MVFDENGNFSEEEFNKRMKASMVHPLVKQGEEILKVIKILLESTDDAYTKEMYGKLLLESAYIINAKLPGAVRSSSYLVKLQSAAVIREHAEYLRLSYYHLKDMEKLDKNYIAVLRSEMERFRKLFRQWANEIHKMKEGNEFKDEWGLF